MEHSRWARAAQARAGKALDRRGTIAACALKMISDLAVRIALPADAATIAALSRDEIEHGLPWTGRAPRVRHAMDDPDTNVIVAGPPDAVRAFGIMDDADGDAHLLLFAVHHAHPRRGAPRQCRRAQLLH